MLKNINNDMVEVSEYTKVNGTKVNKYVRNHPCDYSKSKYKINTKLKNTFIAKSKVVSTKKETVTDIKQKKCYNGLYIFIDPISQKEMCDVSLRKTKLFLNHTLTLILKKIDVIDDEIIVYDILLAYKDHKPIDFSKYNIDNLFVKKFDYIETRSILFNCSKTHINTNIASDYDNYRYDKKNYAFHNNLYKKNYKGFNTIKGIKTNYHVYKQTNDIDVYVLPPFCENYDKNNVIKTESYTFDKKANNRTPQLSFSPIFYYNNINFKTLIDMGILEQKLIDIFYFKSINYAKKVFEKELFYIEDIAIIKDIYELTFKKYTGNLSYLYSLFHKEYYDTIMLYDSVVNIIDKIEYNKICCELPDHTSYISELRMEERCYEMRYHDYYMTNEMIEKAYYNKTTYSENCLNALELIKFLNKGYHDFDYVDIIFNPEHSQVVNNYYITIPLLYNIHSKTNNTITQLSLDEFLKLDSYMFYKIPKNNGIVKILLDTNCNSIRIFNEIKSFKKRYTKIAIEYCKQEVNNNYILSDTIKAFIYSITAFGILEKLYKSYNENKLRKVVNPEDYRQDNTETNYVYLDEKSILESIDDEKMNLYFKASDIFYMKENNVIYICIPIFYMESIKNKETTKYNSDDIFCTYDGLKPVLKLNNSTDCVKYINQSETYRCISIETKLSVPICRHERIKDINTDPERYNKKYQKYVNTYKNTEFTIEDIDEALSCI